MIRGLALTASFLLAGAMPALAQTHSHGPGHVRPGAGQHQPHGPGHVRPDSGQHAAMHALLHGSWTGTFRSAHGLSSGLDMSVAHDSAHKMALRMSTDQPLRAGAASNFVMDGAKLIWTQDLSGKSCKATAVLTAATPLAPETMEGKMACEHGESSFTLRKKTG